MPVCALLSKPASFPLIDGTIQSMELCPNSSLRTPSQLTNVLLHFIFLQSLSSV